jgi:glycosyltransferase involved in cell wall biosynthesis
MRGEPVRASPVAPPLRVLQLGSPNGLFGAERWILALVRHLPRDRVESLVGVVRDDPAAGRAPLLARAEALGLESVEVDAPGRLSVAAVAGLRRLIRERAIDILHTHFYKTTILGAFAVRGTGCRLLATPHGWNTDAGLKLQAYEWAERLAFARADAVAPLSVELERGLARLPWLRERLTLIPNGVDLDEVTASDDVADEVRDARAAGAFVVGYVGQLIGRKRVDTLIDAFAAMHVPDKRLFVVGDGPDRTALERRAHEAGLGGQVTFTGFRDDRLSLLRGFDAIVLPSLLEGIPRCLMEAMAAGVAMVATDIEGTRELVEHQTTGLLFPPGQAAMLAAHLDTLAGDPDLRDRLVRAARHRVETRFSGAAMAGRYLELFQTLAADGTALRPASSRAGPSTKGIVER